jgi:endogenous inhibitor of DNA gyrase (YacG/DUF329 family)
MSQAGNTPKQLKAPCPQCGQAAVLDSSNAWRPFCCERCKLLDLGEWFAGRYSVTTAESDETPPEDGTLQ